MNIPDALAIAIVTVTGGLISSLALHFYIKEKKKWNKGRCPDCGEPWEFVGYEHYGERVYVCKDNKHMCIIDYKTIDKHKEDK